MNPLRSGIRTLDKGAFEKRKPGNKKENMWNGTIMRFEVQPYEKFGKSQVSRKGETKNNNNRNIFLEHVVLILPNLPWSSFLMMDPRSMVLLDWEIQCDGASLLQMVTEVTSRNRSNEHTWNVGPIQ